VRKYCGFFEIVRSKCGFFATDSGDTREETKLVQKKSDVEKVELSEFRNKILS
jgi:hypothetical protein